VATTETGKNRSTGSKSIEELGDDDLSGEALSTMSKTGVVVLLNTRY
jgi:hypothetical protein